MPTEPIAPNRRRSIHLAKWVDDVARSSQLCSKQPSRFMTLILGLSFWVLSGAIAPGAQARSPQVSAPTSRNNIAAPARDYLIVMLGDSLTAGYGLARKDAPPAQIEARLKAQGYRVQIINAGSSGDIVAGGLSRLDWSVPLNADAVMIELGANDMLQGLPVANVRSGLEAMIRKLKSRAKAPQIALAGMRGHAGLAPAYRREFDQIYPELARQEKIALYPFFLDGVALNATLNQGDGIHPNAMGAKIIADKISAFMIANFPLPKASSAQSVAP